MPAAIGSIAAYLQDSLDETVEIKLFKYPQDLSNYLQTAKADEWSINIAGFSHYVWNRNLSLSFANIIKKNFEDSVIIFGGPNFPTDLSEQEGFLRKNPIIDFHIVKEGEKPFRHLVENLIKYDFDTEKISVDQSNLVFIDGDGLFQASEKVERTLNLEELPSPYLSGLMDEFFDGKLLPIIQTNRGCPFKCTFCTEGMNHWNKVYASSQNKIDSEIYYISKKMVSLGSSSRSDLHIADSNFGMYKQDVDTANTLRQSQDLYDYPRYINVATGKNKKERVLEVARIVNGAMKLAGSVQSLDETVLKNIKRSNIGVDEIIELGNSADQIGANSYSEVILGLPGDTLTSHFSTIETLVDAGFNTICMYQFMILPGTESGSFAAQEDFQMETRWRLLPRCYGYFDVLGDQVNVGEAEEICVSTNSLSFDDYLNCRKMNLIVNVFYNDGVFRELLKFLKLEGVSIWDWLLRIYQGMEKHKLWNATLEKFLDETKQELWMDKESLLDSVQDRENITKYIEGQLGGNLMFKYKGLSMTNCLSDVADIAQEAAIDVLKETSRCTPDKEAFVDDIVNYNLCRMTDIFVFDPQPTSHRFDFDINRFSEDEYPKEISDYRYAEPREIHFEFDGEQVNELQNYQKLFGISEHGISRILSRVYIRKMFRRAQSDETGSEQERFLLIKGQATLSGLNEFD